MTSRGNIEHGIKKTRIFTFYDERAGYYFSNSICFETAVDYFLTGNLAQP